MATSQVTTSPWGARYRQSCADQPARADLLAYADRYGRTEHVHALLDAHAAEVLTLADRPDEAALHALAADIHAREAQFFAARLSAHEVEAEITRLKTENTRLATALAKASQ